MRHQCRFKRAILHPAQLLTLLSPLPHAQVASTIIAAVGFNGYPWPPEGVNNCQFCQLSTGNHHPIFSRQAPLFGTESAWTDSTIGCLCAPQGLSGSGC